MDIAINAWFWDQPATGSGQYVRHLLPAMAALEPGFRFLAATPSRMEPQCSIPNLHPYAASSARLLDRIPNKSRCLDLYKLWFEQVLFPRLAVRHQTAIAHVPYFASPVRPSAPTVVTVHDLIPIVLPAYRGSALVRAYTCLVAAGARRADALIADSESTGRDIITHLKVDPQRVHVIPLAADSRFRPAAAEELQRVRSRYGLPDRYVLYLGGFDRRKSVTTLLRAFAQLKHESRLCATTRLVIAGRLPATDTDFTPDPRRIAAQLGIEASVVFPGWIDEADKPALYSGAQLFVFPSTYEGFGLPVLEAMACGTPVVTSNTSSLPEVVGEAGLTVPPDDPGALAQAIAILLGDEARRQALRQAGLVQAARFSWERTARATLTVLKENMA